MGEFEWKDFFRSKFFASVSVTKVKTFLLLLVIDNLKIKVLAQEISYNSICVLFRSPKLKKVWLKKNSNSLKSIFFFSTSWLAAGPHVQQSGLELAAFHIWNGLSRFSPPTAFMPSLSLLSPNRFIIEHLYFHTFHHIFMFEINIYWNFIGICNLFLVILLFVLLLITFGHKVVFLISKSKSLAWIFPLH